MTENEAHGQAFEHGRAVGYEQCRRELLPCKIGDTVWGIRKGRGGSRWVAQGRVYRMYYADDMRLCICVKSVCFGFWGQQVFASWHWVTGAMPEPVTDIYVEVPVCQR